MLLFLLREGLGWDTVATLQGRLRSPGSSSHNCLTSYLVPLSPSIALSPEPALHLHVLSSSAGAEAALSAKREKVSEKEDSRDLLIFCADHAGLRGTSLQMLISPIAPKSSTDLLQPFLHPSFLCPKAH